MLDDGLRWSQTEGHWRPKHWRRRSTYRRILRELSQVTDPLLNTDLMVELFKAQYITDDPPGTQSIESMPGRAKRVTAE